MAVVSNDFTVRSNLFNVNPLNSGGIRIRNMERWQALDAGVAATSQPLAPFSFPYLKGLAANFGRYRWHSLKVIYKTAVATITPGQYAMGLTYSAGDAPNTFSGIGSLAGAVTAPLWQNSELVMDGRSTFPWYRFCDATFFAALAGESTSAALVAQDSFVAAFFNQVSTATAGTVSGILFVEYDVELIDPIQAADNVG